MNIARRLVRSTSRLPVGFLSRAAAFAILAIATFGLAGCEAQCSVSSARLSEETMAPAVNAETKAPTAAATTFASDVPVIYATAKLSSAPDGTRIKAEFYYLEGGERQIAADEVQAGGSRYVFFTVTPPLHGWPPGQYETRFYLDGKPGKRLPFNILGAPTRHAPVPLPVSAPQSPAPPAAGATPGMKRFHDDKFGIAFELPSTWTYRVTPRKDYMIEGPKGTDAFEIAIVLQFVQKLANPGSSAMAQARGLVSQLQSMGATIQASDTLKIAGQQAPYFNASYTTKDSRGVAGPFSHTQLVLDHGDYYYLVSYAGPEAIYRKYLTVFQHMTSTFAFTF